MDRGPWWGTVHGITKKSDMAEQLTHTHTHTHTQIKRDLIISSVQSLSHVWLFVTPWTAARQASLSVTNSRSLFKLMSIKSVMPPNHLILCCLFYSHVQSFPAWGSFQMNQFFESGGQSIGVSASASVLPMTSGLISFRMDWLDLLAV